MQFKSKDLAWRNWIKQITEDEPDFSFREWIKTTFNQYFKKIKNKSYFYKIKKPVNILGKINKIVYSVGNNEFVHTFEKETPFFTTGDLNQVSFPCLLSSGGIIDYDFLALGRRKQTPKKELEFVDGFLAGINPKTFQTSPNDVQKIIEKSKQIQATDEELIIRIPYDSIPNIQDIKETEHEKIEIENET